MSEDCVKFTYFISKDVTCAKHKMAISAAFEKWAFSISHSQITICENTELIRNQHMFRIRNGYMILVDVAINVGKENVLILKLSGADTSIENGIFLRL